MAPNAIEELSHRAWSPELLIPVERFAWEMIPAWVWRQQAQIAARWDDMPEALDVPEPPWSDPLVLDVSEWWARRRTSEFEAELAEMTLSFGRKLHQLGLVLTACAARRGLGPAVLERAAFTVRREGMDQQDVYDILNECADVMLATLGAGCDGAGPQNPAAPPSAEGLAAAEPYDIQGTAFILLPDDDEEPTDGLAYCACRISHTPVQHLRSLARERLRALKGSDPHTDPEAASASVGCTLCSGGIRDELIKLHAEVTAAVVADRIRRADEGSVEMQFQLAAEGQLGMTANHEQIAAAAMLGIAAQSLSTNEALELVEQALILDSCCDVIEDLRADLERHWDYWPW